MEDGEAIVLALLTSDQISIYKNRYRFFCPMCKGKVIVKNGHKTIAHFAHQKHTTCTNDTGGEGEYHEKGKLDLYYWLKNQGLSVELEKYLPDLAQRPDIFVRINRKQIAIEYQCANIPLSTFLKRTNGYLSSGITPIWILGGNRVKRKSNTCLDVTSSDLHFIHQFNASISKRLFYYCPLAKQFAVYQNVILTGRKRTIGNLVFSQLSTFSFTDLFKTTEMTTRQLYDLWLQEKNQLRIRSQFSMTTAERQWRQWLYIKGLNTSNISAAIHLPLHSQWRMKTHPWDWQSRLCLDFMEIKPVFTLNECRNFLQRYLEPVKSYPLIYPTGDPINEYLQLLEQLRFIKKKSTHYYHLQTKFKSYQTVEVASKADTEIMLQLKKVSKITHEN